MLYVPPKKSMMLLNFSNAAELRVHDGANWKVAGYVFAQGVGTDVWEQWVYVKNVNAGSNLAILPALSPTHDTPAQGDVQIRALQDAVASATPSTKRTLLQDMLNTGLTHRPKYFLDNVLQLLKFDDANVAEDDLKYIVGKVVWQTPPLQLAAERQPASKRKFTLNDQGTLVAVLYQETKTTGNPHTCRYHQLSTRKDCIPAPNRPLDYSVASGGLNQWYSQATGAAVWYSVTDATHYNKLMKFDDLPPALRAQFPTAASNNTCP